MPTPARARARGHGVPRQVRWLLVLLLAGGIAPWASPSTLATAPAHLLVVYTAYTRGGNLYMVDGRGADVTLTTRASTTEASAISYPWYAWSPDGAFLLLLRQHPSETRGGGVWDLLLLDRRGGVLRTLATDLPQAPFYPTWAVDADQIAFEAGLTQTSGTKCCLITLHHQVRVVTTAGRLTGAWHYTTAVYADGGPPFDWFSPVGAQWLYLREQGWVGMHPRLPLSWSSSRHLAIFAAWVGLATAYFLSVDTTTSSARILANPGAWASVALAPAGNELAVATAAHRTVALADARSGALLRTIASGEQPVWSPDGHWLYYEQRVAVKELTIRGAGQGWQLMDGDTYTATPAATEDAYSSAIWRVAPAVRGARPERLTVLDAYGLGRVQPMGDGRSVIFSQVDNSWAFWRQRGADAATRVRHYGPRVSVRRLETDGRLTVLASDAGLPAVSQ